MSTVENERYGKKRERKLVFTNDFSIDIQTTKKLRNETELLVGENQQTEEQIMINHVKMCGFAQNEYRKNRY